MKRYILLAISVILLAAVAASGILTIGGITPEIVLMFVLCYVCVEERCIWSMIFAAVCGIIMGSLGGRGIGFTIVWYLYSALLCYLGSRKGRFAKLKPALLFSVLTVILGEGIFYLIYFLGEADLVQFLRLKLLGAVIYNVICTLVLFYPTRRLFRLDEEKAYRISDNI